ncbi:hypothetical protein [Sediminibacillus terrae]|nr:hypothetical protein [Sediminibacillus terrae]
MKKNEQASRTAAFPGSERKKQMEHPLVDFLSIGYGKKQKAVKLP